MKRASRIAILLMLGGRCFGAEPLGGEWVHTDIRSLEVLDKGTCVRLWLEERTYRISVNGESLTGTYVNQIRATPVGAPSLRPECRYPAPVSKPSAAQFRIWSLAGRLNQDGSWRIGAQPELGGGDLSTFKTEEFKARLVPVGAALIDAVNNLDDANSALVFRRRGIPAAAARAVFEDTLGRLHAGRCMQVMMDLGETQPLAAQICDLRQRMLALSGSYVSVRVDEATVIDRVPDLFPRQSGGFRRQSGVYFSFTAQYEKQEIPGGAIVYEEDDKWRVASLWL